MEHLFSAGHIKQADFDNIRSLVYEQTGIKLSEQKKAMIQSRLMKRLKQIGCPSFDRYVRMVKLDAAERAIMFNLLTTNVTKFFRENHHFEYLSQIIVPEFMKGPRRTRPLKVWSAGCSTGQEPYSLGVVLNEIISRWPEFDYRILATDINTEVLKKASEGKYIWEEVSEIPYSLLKKNFKLGTGPNSGLFKIKDQVRKRVNFRYLNLASPGGEYPVEGVYDLICCRNVFIYFDQETKMRAIKRFYNKLVPGGCLFLGHSESLNLQDSRLGCWSLQQHTVYRKEETGVKKRNS